MTPSSDPPVEPSYTRASVELYLRATADQRQWIESEIDEARARTERARSQLERIRGCATGPDTLVPARAEVALTPDAGTGDTDTASSSLIDRLRLTMPSERDRWERSEVPTAVDHE
jgi:hypothetical protein